MKIAEFFFTFPI